MSDETYDVAVVGAGPAGAAAAALLASREHSVLLVDQAHFPRDGEGGGWLSVRALALLSQLGISARALSGRPVKDVTFHNADFTKSAKPVLEASPAQIIDRAHVANALVNAAVKKGATLVSGVGVTDVVLKEDHAELKLTDERTMRARLLVLAVGWNAPLLERIGLARPRSPTGFWTAQVDAPVGERTGPVSPRVGVVLGLNRGGSFSLCCASKERAFVGVSWVGERDEAVGALAGVCRLAFEHGALPVDLTSAAGSAEVRFSPAGAALDLDSHIAKHTLVIGEAGGFIASASNEGLYPAMWSGEIATDVVEKALQGVHSQDELMQFDSAWRMKMADYLRSPQTDSQFLLPLVFSNQPMANRMAAAFFSGENI